MTTDALFDASEYDDFRCNTCGESIEPGDEIGDNCPECYINPDCPAGCNEDHAPPTPDSYSGQWDCPATGTTYRIDTTCGEEWDEDRRGEGSHLIGDTWHWDPWESGYQRCTSCDDWTSEALYDRWEDPFCSRCYYDQDDSEFPDNVVECDSCHRLETPTHYHPVTEDGLCATCAENTPGAEPLPELAAA